jgi:hypothetical protein
LSLSSGKTRFQSLFFFKFFNVYRYTTGEGKLGHRVYHHKMHHADKRAARAREGLSEVGLCRLNQVDP